MALTDDDLRAIRQIIREEIQEAIKKIPGSSHVPEPDRIDFDLRGAALVMGLDIYPSDWNNLIDCYKVSGKLPNSMKESWQRFEDWGSTKDGRLAAAMSHRAFLDSLADRRNKLKAEGKWPPSKKKTKTK